MSAALSNNGMSESEYDVCTAPTSTVKVSSEEKMRSLVKALCDIDLETLSDDAMNSLIKETLRSAVCKPALALKNEIVQDMELDKMVKCLKTHIQRMKIFIDTYIETQKNEIEKPPSDPEESEYFKMIERRKGTTMTNIGKIMAEVTEIEERLSASKSLWECFRENYKKGGMAFVNKKIRDYQEGITSVSVIKWEDFLPKVASRNGYCVMTYYD